MSVQNVVSKEQLIDIISDMGTKINSMPSVFVNMFNRSDLYSTNEKIVGCWVDGKPLYQIAKEDTGSFSGNVNNFITLPSNATPIKASVFGVGSGVTANLFFPIPYIHPDIASQASGYYINASNAMNLRFGSEAIYSKLIVIVQYTKTTDTPIKVGTGNDYSTNEQIIGTWIDGKPLYQKTIYYRKIDAGTTPVATNFCSSNSISKICRMFAIMQGDGGMFSETFTRGNPGQDSFTVWVDPSDILQLNFGNPNPYPPCDVYITVQYTKTTD